MTAAELNESSCVIRGTNGNRGRVAWLNPEKGAVRHLRYGRIILDAGGEPIQFSTEDQETGFICLKGAATIHCLGRDFVLGKYDALYIPRGTQLAVVPGAAGCDLAETGATVDNNFPAQF